MTEIPREEESLIDNRLSRKGEHPGIRISSIVLNRSENESAAHGN